MKIVEKSPGIRKRKYSKITEEKKNQEERGKRRNKIKYMYM
jgi:hypothetical protein